MKWFIIAMEQYATFSGRAHRTEYWLFTLFSMIFYLAARILDHILGSQFYIISPMHTHGYISTVVTALFLLPSTAVGVRRLHDTGRSGFLIVFVTLFTNLFNYVISPFASTLPHGIGLLLSLGMALATLVMVIVLIVWLATRGHHGPNQYGEDPCAADMLPPRYQ